MSYIESLRQTGNDAYQNLFDVIITPAEILGVVDLSHLKFRIKNFTVPSSGSETYEHHYKTMKILKTTAKINVEQTFSFDFSMDEYYEEYRILALWKNAVANTWSGDIGRLSSVSAPITVLAYSVYTPEIPVRQWTFTGARVTTLGDVSFDYSSGEALQVNVTFTFDLMNDVG